MLIARSSERSAMAVRLPLPRKKAPSPIDKHALYDAGVVTGDERVVLERFWRSEFEAAYAPGYDAARRRAHFRDIDLPASLRKRWMAERKRRGRTIKKLAAEAGEPAGVTG